MWGRTEKGGGWGGGGAVCQDPSPEESRASWKATAEQQGEWKPQKQLPLTSEPLCKGNFLKAGHIRFSAPEPTGSHLSVFVTVRISYPGWVVFFSFRNIFHHLVISGFWSGGGNVVN